MIKKTFLVVGLIIYVTCIYAQAPKYSNEFMAIGLGARALGMGNANTAIVDDASAGYWNPSGLVLLPAERQLSLMHSEYFAGIAKFDYGAFAARIDEKSSVGFTIIRFGVDDIPNTTDLIDNEGNIHYDRITSFSAADYGFLFSYARKSSVEGLSYGANVKIIRRVVGDFAGAWGFGLDAGMQYESNSWKFGVLGKDITSTFNAWNFTLNDKTKEIWTLTGNEIPENSLELTLPRLIIGIGKEINFSESFSTLIAIDFDMTFDGMRNVLVKSDLISIDPHMGLEISYKKFLFLRAGVNNIQEETDMNNEKIATFQPNMGVGVKIKNTFAIDYALTDIGDNSIALYSNVFSLKFNFNKKVIAKTIAE